MCPGHPPTPVTPLLLNPQPHTHTHLQRVNIEGKRQLVLSPASCPGLYEAFLDFVCPQPGRCFQGQTVAPEENPEEGGKNRTQHQQHNRTPGFGWAR